MRNSKILIALILGFLASMTPACNGSHGDTWGADDDEDDEPIDQCPPLDCGLNSNHMYGLPFFELELGGKANNSGYSIDGFYTAGGEPLSLDIQDGRFIGRDARGELVAGSDVVGSYLVVSDGVDSFEIHVLDLVDDMQYIGRPGAYAPAYHLGVSGPSEVLDTRNHCAPAADDHPAWSGFETRAVLLRGEKYNAGSITVEQSGPAARDWFYIGCEGTATYDAKLLGYAPDADDATSATSVDARQAAYKMIMADYCGTGTSFTLQGEAVLWANDRGSISFDQHLADSLEAVWTEDGAACLSTPRLADTAPFIADMIAAECYLPACDELLDGGLSPDSWSQHGSWITYNP